MHTLPRPLFSSTAEYASYFTQPAFWRPYIEHACAEWEIPCRTISEPIPGTNVVFLIDKHYVIKLFPELFDGAMASKAEMDMYVLLSEYQSVEMPRLIGIGDLFDSTDGWPWPYMLTTRLRGQPVSASQLSPSDRHTMAAWTAQQLRGVHRVRPESWMGPRFVGGWACFDAFLAEQRRNALQNHRVWASLPDHLIAQLDDYLVPEHATLGRHAEPLVLHADLHADHILGEESSLGWRSNGIIDFDDARIGDIAYELPPIYLSLFARDKGLLQHFLDSYGIPADQQPALRQRAMHMTLLHEFNVLDGLREQQPELMQLATLQELHQALWT